MQNEYRQRVKPGARPLVILQPMGPVMFVFDVSDTEPLPGAPDLPREVVSPFEVRGGTIGDQFEKTIENGKRDGIRVTSQNAGSQHAGEIGRASNNVAQDVIVRRFPMFESVKVPVRYELLLNGSMSREARYATLAHELGHLYCGHIGSPNDNWWPDRRGLSLATREFEAESVCYLVCGRAGIDNPSEEYLAAYLGQHPVVPEISLDRLMTAAGLIEKMGIERLNIRKQSARKQGFR